MVIVLHVRPLEPSLVPTKDRIPIGVIVSLSILIRERRGEVIPSDIHIEGICQAGHVDLRDIFHPLVLDGLEAVGS